MNLKKAKSLTFISALLLFMLCGCGNSDVQKTERQVFTMDTAAFLTAYGNNAEQGLDLAEGALLSLNEALDPSLPDSEVYALNNAKGSPTTVPEAVLSMFDAAKTVFENSGGALDLAVYPLTKAWGFTGGEFRVPATKEIESLREEADFAGIIADGNSLIMPMGTEISFGSVAKGYAAELVTEILRDSGVESAIISLGGNVQTLGVKPDGSLWAIGIQNPLGSGEYIAALEVGKDTAVVTSGSYQRYFEVEGKVYHHILDPDTGYPADSGLLSVTIVCFEGTVADALSTALFVLGEDGAINYYQVYGGFEFVLITKDNRVVVSPGLHNSFTEHNESFEFFYL